MKKESVVKKFGRVLIPIVTPFDVRGNVSIPDLKKVLGHIRKNDLSDSIIVGGTNGEFVSLTIEERLKIFETVRENVHDQPVIAGTGTPSTKETIQLTRAAEEMGMDMAMVVSPYYQKPCSRGLLEHFQEVAKSTRLPITLYNIPIFAGVNIDPEVVKELAKIDNVVAVKEEVAINPIQVTQFILATNDTFPVYCGDDTMVLSALSQGAVGAVSGGSHIIGREMKMMIDLFLNGKVEKAKSIHHKIYPLFRAFSGEGRVNPIPLLKEALNLIGVRVGGPRLPLQRANKKEREALAKVLKDLRMI
jgi:4-hydroxy-tetrahydrodipicolinate synthase